VTRASRFLTGLLTHALPGFALDGPQPPILPPKDGFLFLHRDKLHASFAADLPTDPAGFMAD
jgi:hypothetical protein